MYKLAQKLIQSSHAIKKINYRKTRKFRIRALGKEVYLSLEFH